MASLKIKLVDLPEIQYMSTDEMPRGEIYVKGASVFKGYFHNEEATQKVFDQEGWLKTGDIGMLYPNGAIKIIDRV